MAGMPTSLPLLILAAVLGALLATVLGYYAARGRLAAALQAGRAEREPELAAVTAEKRAVEQRLADFAERADELVVRERSLQAQLSQAVAERASLLAKLEAAIAQSRDRDQLLSAGAREREQLLATAREQLRESFKVLAGEILEDKSRRFAESNKTELGTLLDPLKVQLKEFRETVHQTYANEQRERGSLTREIQTLRELNQRMSEDAVNLTRALKGDTRAQGAWGELVLERLLEASGLTAGREYVVQTVVKDGDGGRPRPDAIIRLPEDKDLVVDAKMSLVAYERHCAATGDAERQLELAAHVASVRRHIDNLAGKNYAGLDGLRTLDFVLMFVPVEAAFIEAVRADGELYTYALSRNISIVSPSTLLATLRTVAHLWRLERQNVNAVDIAKRAAQLHDNFVLLAGELEHVGESLQKAVGAHDKALRRLTQGGKGSVILQVKSLAEMGAPAQKKLPKALLAAADADGDDEAPELPSA